MLSAKITLQDVTAEANLRVEDLNHEVSSQSLLELAEFFVRWKLIGKQLNLTDAEIAAADSDVMTEDEKRVKILQRWKKRYAFKQLIEC